MADVIEVAKSGRASCRTCKNAIAKGELRFGEEVVNQFSGEGDTTHRWHHMKCAAEKLPHKLKDAMDAYQGEIPERAEIEKAIEESAKKQKGKSDAFPYADVAPTGRAKCIQCRAPIEKGAVRIAVEREIEVGMTTTMGAGYLHPSCVKPWVEASGKTTLEDLLAGVRKHTTAFSGEELEELLSGI